MDNGESGYESGFGLEGGSGSLWESGGVVKGSGSSEFLWSCAEECCESTAVLVSFYLLPATCYLTYDFC